MKKLFITLLFLFTFLQADTYEFSSYSTEDNAYLVKPEPIYEEDNRNIKAGVALNIRPKVNNKLNIKIAYEGDFMLINNLVDEENKVQNNNYYLGIGYKF